MGKPTEYEVLLLGLMMIKYALAHSSIMVLNASLGNEKDVEILKHLVEDMEMSSPCVISH